MQVATDELHPRNQRHVASFTALDAQDSDEYLHAHDELEVHEVHSDIAADRHNEGLLTAADENIVRTVVKDELSPITQTGTTDSGSEGMLSARSSATVYSATEEIPKA